MKESGRNKIKAICTIGVGIALYVAVGAVMKIPLISHIQTDLGYTVFGAYCVWFGWKGIFVGAAGATLTSLIFSGWFPIGWILGQCVIGLICGAVYCAVKKSPGFGKYILGGTITAVAVFIGIAVIKTVIECNLYTIPFEVKFPKNVIAFIADTIPMIIGMIIGFKLNNKMAKGE